MDNNMLVDIRDSLRMITGHLARIAESLEQSPVMRVQKVNPDAPGGAHERPDSAYERSDSERPDSQPERSDSDFTIRIGDRAIVRKTHGNWAQGDEVVVSAIVDDGDTVIVSGFSGVEHNYMTDIVNPLMLQLKESVDAGSTNRAIRTSESRDHESAGEPGVQGTGD